jgi:hypothetical protein
MSRCYDLLLAMLTLTVLLAVPAVGQTTAPWPQVGTLSCKVDPNIGLVIVGHQPLNCLFTPAPGTPSEGPPQAYDGAINTTGLNIGVSAGSILGWLCSRRAQACLLVPLPVTM